MNPLIIINVFRDSEIPMAMELSSKCGDSLRIISHKTITFVPQWKVSSMEKSTVEWTRRIIEKFLQEKEFDCLLKIDPDIVVKGNTLPMPPENCDIAGEFRYSRLGLVWFGAYQYFTRTAGERILADPQYTGKCRYQDVALAASAVRLNLVGYNMPEVNVWCNYIEWDTTSATILHQAKSKLERLSHGYIHF